VKYKYLCAITQKYYCNKLYVESIRCGGELKLVRKREEEYLEMIYLLSKKKGFVRVKDLASKLGVKPPSVVEYLSKLSKKGYISYEKGEYILLNEKGKKIAEEVYRKHEAIKEFLVLLLNIPEEIAEEDACYIEHGIHPETMNRIEKFIEFVKSCPKKVPIWIKHLRKYYVSGEYPEECK